MAPNTPDERPWSPAARIGFRFACVYWLLYDLPYPLSELGGFAWAQERYDALWAQLIPWVGKHVLRLPAEISVLPNGSGDTTFNYVQVLCFVALASIASVIWALLDRRRKQYVVLHDWLRLYLRFTLAAAMWGYGMHKVLPLQFGTPDGEYLSRTYGESSPMGLLWTFMSASVPYTIFAGASEVLAGTLLFFRRTTTLGALVTVAVTANIVALNFCYDVPVKLYSMHLLAHAVFLALPDASRLVRVFVTNRATTANDLGPPAGPRWLTLTRRVGWVAFVGWTVFANVATSLAAREEYAQAEPKRALDGCWNVTSFARNGEPASAASGGGAWERLCFTSRGSCTIHSSDGERSRVIVEYVPDSQQLKLKTIGPDAAVYDFTWAKDGDWNLTLEGMFGADRIDAILRLVPESSFLLTSRGFHWINEYPFNR